MISANGVDAGGPHEIEVVVDGFRKRKRFSLGIGREWTISNAMEAHALGAARKEPAVDAQTGAVDRLWIGEQCTAQRRLAALDDCESVIHGANPAVLQQLGQRRAGRLEATGCLEIHVDCLSIALVAEAAEYGGVDRI